MLNDNPSIEISVVVPVRDEEDSIRDLLRGLLNQTLAPHEILITDGGSRDATIRIIEEFITSGAPIKLFREQESMPGHARNVGASHAACEWIAFTDAGTIPSADWLQALIEKAKDNSEIDIVYGAFEPVTDTLFKQCAVMAYLQPPMLLEGHLTPPPSVASALMRRTAWATVGGFPEHLRSAEDIKFMDSLAQSGFKHVRAPGAVVRWSIQPSLWGTFKRFVVYARNNMRAGLWRQWQATVLTRYGLLVLSAMPAFWLGSRWLLMPLVLWLLLLAARGIVAIRRYRLVYPAGPIRNAIRLGLLFPILATLDAATIIGTLQWAWGDKLTGAPQGQRNA